MTPVGDWYRSLLATQSIRRCLLIGGKVALVVSIVGAIYTIYGWIYPSRIVVEYELMNRILIPESLIESGKRLGEVTDEKDDGEHTLVEQMIRDHVHNRFRIQLDTVKADLASWADVDTVLKIRAKNEGNETRECAISVPGFQSRPQVAVSTNPVDGAIQAALRKYTYSEKESALGFGDIKPIASGQEFTVYIYGAARRGLVQRLTTPVLRAVCNGRTDLRDVKDGESGGDFARRNLWWIVPGALAVNYFAIRRVKSQVAAK